MPLSTWLRGAPGAHAAELLEATRGSLDPLLAPGGAPALLRRFREGESDLAPVVYATVVLALVELTAGRS